LGYAGVYALIMKCAITHHFLWETTFVI